MEIYKNLSLEDLPNEEWRDVVGYEGLYRVSNLGRVKSLDRTIKFKNSYKKAKGVMLSQGLNFGYCQIALGRKSKKYRVHRLVAEAFIPNPNNYPIINHKDENRSNNVVENLEWCDYSYNLNYGSRKGWQRRMNGVPVCQYTKKGEFVARFNSMIGAAEQVESVTTNNIFHCCNKDTPSCGGFVWRYENDKDVRYVNKNITSVAQYDKRGRFLAKYDSIKEASKATGVISTGISNCILGLSLSSGGYIWRHLNDDDVEEVEEYKNPITKEILCYDMNGNFIKEYRSITEASNELKIASGSISSCCKGKLKTAGKHIFKYK
jgi:hypothetical protein